MIYDDDNYTNAYLYRTTAEALFTGVPCFVTGPLLMDQRFWSTRVAALGVGPIGQRIGDIDDTIVGYVDKALDPNSDWAINAKKVSKLVKAKKSNDGLLENCEMFVKLAKAANPVKKYVSEKKSAAALENIKEESDKNLALI